MLDRYQKNRNRMQNKPKDEPEPAVDEVILKDKRRLVVLDYGGGTDLDGIKEAVDAFKEGNIQ